MSKIDTLLFSVARARRKLMPPIKRALMLPDLFLTDTGEDWPGHEEENMRARRFAVVRRIDLKAYVGFDPNEDGVEP